MGKPSADGTHWRRWFLLFWLLAAAWMVWTRWGAIRGFALPDTDDNMRMMQVRALLGGQGWYDLRQYRMDPPAGANIHWSRLVDLPLAGLILIGRPLLGGAMAETVAVTVAPMLAFGAALYALMLAARRLIGRWAFLLAAAIVVCGNSAMAMWMPLRIDHHGWQLALLLLMVAGIADPKRARGGVTAGLATAGSLAIGLELMPYMALGGALLMLWWVVDDAEAPRLRAYAAALAGGSAAGYLLFVSYDNARPVCDAFSPVWLSATLAAGAAAWGVAGLRATSPLGRLAAMAAVGVLLAAAFAVAWPDCLGRPEHLPPELERTWFANVREAKPIYQHGWRTAVLTCALPVIGALGAILAAWRARGTASAMPWVATAAISTAATALLFWQTRAGPAAQALGSIGATGLAAMVLPRLLGARHVAIRVGGPVGVYALVSGLAAFWIVSAIPQAPAPRGRKAIGLANGRCPTFAALRPIALLPRATVLTFVDLGPRLIVATPHDAIAGPYHRNASAILDVQHAFKAENPAVTRAVIRRHGVTLLLSCPGMSESTIYASQAPHGFYMQLQRGLIPPWLSPIPLTAKSPFKAWRVIGAP